MKRKYLYLFFLGFLLFLPGCGNGNRQEEAQPIDTIPVMLMQIQKCSRLYTSEYQLHKIITYHDSMSLSGSFLRKEFKIDLPAGRRKIAIPMTASVKGYIDFSDFSEKNIRRKGEKIEIILPDPQIMMTSTKIDHDAIKKKVSVFRHNFTDEEITGIQQQGRTEMVRSLHQLGIIENARQSAARQLIPIIEQLGYEQKDIVITFRRKFTLDDIPSLIKKTE